jgi:hypothetical protein
MFGLFTKENQATVHIATAGCRHAYQISTWINILVSDFRPRTQVHIHLPLGVSFEKKKNLQLEEFYLLGCNTV